MPTYDYRCPHCKHVWEEFQITMREIEYNCPKCGKGPAERQVGSGGGVIFKVGGFYETDYKQKK